LVGVTSLVHVYPSSRLNISETTGDGRLVTSGTYRKVGTESIGDVM